MGTCSSHVMYLCFSFLSNKMMILGQHFEGIISIHQSLSMVFGCECVLIINKAIANNLTRLHD